jgi:NAD(P)H dehydrogenase (quinone)
MIFYICIPRLYTAVMQYAVFGVTGQVGGATARALLKSGQKFRAILRNRRAADAWNAQGTDIAIAELDNADALRTAFSGVDALFLMTPPYFTSPDPIAENRAAIETLRNTIVEAGVSYVVYLSSIGAQHASGLGAIATKYELEQAMRSLDIATVGIRAGWFMENYGGHIGPAEATGTLPSMLDPLDLAVPMISTEDIGRTAAELLQSPRSGKRVVELATGEYSSNDVARALSSILHRNVTPFIVPCDERVAMYRSWGFSDHAASEMSDMIDGFNSQWIAFEGGAIERLHGTITLKTALEHLAARTSSPTL